MSGRLRRLFSHVHLGTRVPVAIAAYALLGVLDLGFSKLAFFAGYGEANPVLAATLTHGTFEVSKVLLTVLIVLVGTVLWPLGLVRGVVWAANFGMALLTGIHVFGLVTHVLR